MVIYNNYDERLEIHENRIVEPVFLFLHPFLFYKNMLYVSG